MKKSLSRRQFLKVSGITATGTVVVGGGGMFYGVNIEPENIDINPITLTLPRLTREFDGFRLVQISDIHMDSDWMTAKRLQEIIKLVNDQKADMVAITGDYVTDDALLHADDLVHLLASIESPTVGILGNHDHWTDAGVIREVLASANIIDLNNAVHSLEINGALLHLCGVDDIWEKHDRLDLVLEALPNTGAAILLAHEPDYADTTANTGRFDLQLSGHSHGGQVVLPFIGAPILPHLGWKYPQGQYRVRGMIQYTNRGVGMVPPHIRINCRPEITVFTFRSR